MSEKKEENFVRSDFEPLFDKKTKDMIRRIEDWSLLGGEKKHLTVLFSDIYSFTSYLVNQPLKETVSNLSEYLTEVVDVILRFGVLVDNSWVMKSWLSSERHILALTTQNGPVNFSVHDTDPLIKVFKNNIF